MIPEKTIDSTTFPNCPDTNLGKPYPIVYGDITNALATLKHENGIGYTPGDAGATFGTFQYGSANNYIMAYIVKDSVPGSISKKTLLSELAMKDSANPYYHWNNARERYELYPVAPSGDTPDDQEVVETIASVDSVTGFPDGFLDRSYGMVHALIPAKHTLSLSPENPERSYDTDPDTYATFNDINEIIYYYFEDPPGTTLGWIYGARGIVSYEDGALDESLEIQFQYTDDGGSSWNNVLTSGNNETLPQGAWAASSLVQVTTTHAVTSWSQLRFRIRRLDKVDDSGECRLTDVCGYSVYSTGETTKVATTGQGAIFGSWIDDTGRSNSFDENDLIELPNFVIESLAREKMRLANAQIDTTAFDTAPDGLTDWEFAFQILTKRDSSKVIDNIAKESKSRLYWDESDQLTISVFNENDSYPNSGTNTGTIAGALDIFDEDAIVTDGVFTNHPIKHDSFGLFKMNIDEVKNDFILNYRKNYLSGEFERSLYITNGVGTVGNVTTNINAANLANSHTITGESGLKQLCADSYNNILTTNTWILGSKYIRDDATATKLLQYYIERLTKRRWKVRFVTWENALGVELGDFINVRHTRINNVFETAWMQYQKWEVYKIVYNLDNHQILIEAIEV